MEPVKINLEQNTEEWLQFRRTHIMATDTSKILGLNPWNSALDCYNDKINGKEVIENEAMRRGRELEPLAREFLIKKYGIDLKPMVFESGEYRFIGASLDAVSEDLNKVYEIKTGGATALEKAKLDILDDYVMTQIQTQMYVMELSSITRFFYDSDEVNYELEILRDNKLIEEIKRSSFDFFYNNILTFSPPEDKKYKSNKIEYETEFDFFKTDLTREWKEVKIQLDLITKKEKELKEKIVKNIKGVNTHFANVGVKVHFSKRKGNIDWKKLTDELEISSGIQETYRKEDSVSVHFKIDD